jgi:hypothetical protein
METFVEQDCTIKHEGKEFTAEGAFVSPVYALAYLGKDNQVIDWHGRKIGTYRIISSWPIHSYFSNRMYAVHAVIDGIIYKGRSMGEGMVFRGKA